MLPDLHLPAFCCCWRDESADLLLLHRAGWLEDEPSRATGRTEIRPAAELGPIILCLDTSGSMRGPREVCAAFGAACGRPDEAAVDVGVSLAPCRLLLRCPPTQTVAKALALECLRGAHRQQRQAYLYAFSGPGQVEELELKCEAAALTKLLKFLSYSFEGGTDVDAPLELSLERLRQAEWSRADILMVTDGEINTPSRCGTSRGRGVVPA